MIICVFITIVFTNCDVTSICHKCLPGNEYNDHTVALQIGDDEFLQCCSMIASYLQLYYNRPSRLPRLQLAWSISNRALRKMKPSTKVESNLPAIMEDEDDDDSSSSSDAGYFDRYLNNLCVFFLPHVEIADLLLSFKFVSSFFKNNVLVSLWLQ